MGDPPRVLAFSVSQAGRQGSGDYLVRFTIYLPASKEPDSDSSLLRLAFSVSGSGNGRRKGFRHDLVATGIGSRPPEANRLFAETLLPPGAYALSFPGNDQSPWRFRLFDDPTRPVRTLCGHPVRRPTWRERLEEFSARGKVIAAVWTSRIAPCCAAAVAPDRPKGGEGPFPWVFLQPLSGRHGAFVSGRPVTLRAGTYLLGPPRQIGLDVSRKPLLLRQVNVGLDVWRSLWSALGMSDRTSSIDFATGPHVVTPSLKLAIAQLEGTLRHPNAPGAPVAIEAAARGFLMTLLREHPNAFRTESPGRTGAPALDPRLRLALDYLARNLDAPYDAREMARAADVSAELLWKLFKDHLGKTPNHLLQEMRVEKAIQLLRDPALSIEEVARSVGYANVRSFRRIFRDRAGKTVGFFRPARRDTGQVSGPADA